jgi:hypothetical protein
LRPCRHQMTPINVSKTPPMVRTILIEALPFSLIVPGRDDSTVGPAPRPTLPRLTLESIV